jgi:hypothetical protein
MTYLLSYLKLFHHEKLSSLFRCGSEIKISPRMNLSSATFSSQKVLVCCFTKGPFFKTTTEICTMCTTVYTTPKCRYISLMDHVKKIESEQTGVAARVLYTEPFMLSKTNLTACINCSDFIHKVCLRIGHNNIVPTASGFGSTKIMFCVR